MMRHRSQAIHLAESNQYKPKVTILVNTKNILENESHIPSSSPLKKRPLDNEFFVLLSPFAWPSGVLNLRTIFDFINFRCLSFWFPIRVKGKTVYEDVQ